MANEDIHQIDGREIADKIIEKLKVLPTPKKILAAVLVGNDGSTHSISSGQASSPQVQASISFLKQKEKTAKELGVDFRIYKLSSESKNDDLRNEVGKIANLKRVGGVIVQLPLPEHVNRHYALNTIPREKDIDVLGERALGAFYTGRNPVLPPAVGVVQEILKSYDLNLKSLKVAMVGLGFLVGKPIAHWLMGDPSTKLGARCAEIYLLDEGSDLSILKRADLTITGVGITGLIKPEMLKNNAVVIDFGYDTSHGSISGDLETNQLINQLTNKLTYTPTPGGTGPILVAKLFENFYKLTRM